ncbi:MAG: bifunctional nicotinamidase/pyrazinamidase [Deltaproteobacteria bacterium]|nr:bifunctional nicotinamidase/pyrazinamidase [Deltaproteobacteria bacterium]
MKTGVIVVDVQADFTELKQGALAVRGTDRVFIDGVRWSTEMFKEAKVTLVATQDWHPHNHISFYTSHEGKRPFDVTLIRGKEQVLWPPHCIQGTAGAELVLDEGFFDAFIKTGTDAEYESYSGFKDDGGSETDLHRILQQRGVTNVIVYGIATDYCVKATVMDALVRGYTVMVVKSLMRGVDPDTSARAVEEMKKRGAVLLDKLDGETLRESCGLLLPSS